MAPEPEDFRPPSYRMTPLSWAANGGHEAVVKMLLEWDDVKPDTVGRFGETPLLKAAAEGHEGETILFGAASWGQEEIVKILLE